MISTGSKNKGKAVVLPLVAFVPRVNGLMGATPLRVAPTLLTLGTTREKKRYALKSENIKMRCLENFAQFQKPERTFQTFQN